MGAIDASALVKWRSAIGRSETRRERLEVESLRRYALAVGAGPDVERNAPPLAHWAFFLPDPQDGEIGEAAELVSTVADTAHKGGRSGDLVFVEVDRVLTQACEVRVRERQSYVYRTAGAPTPAVKPRGDPSRASFGIPNRSTCSASPRPLQRLPHPLRRALRARGGGLSGPGGARPVHPGQARRLRSP